MKVDLHTCNYTIFIYTNIYTYTNLFILHFHPSNFIVFIAYMCFTSLHFMEA